MLRRLFSTVSLSMFVALGASAQVGSGSLKGSVKDKKSGEPLPFVSVVVEKSGVQITGGSTDFDGDYFIKPIDPGTYDVVIAYTGYQPSRQQGVVVNSNVITFLDITLNSGIELKEFEVVQYTVPLIQRDGGASGGTITRDNIAKMPGRSAASIATTVAGASTAGTGGEISIRGSRTENTYYYIDGVKVPAGAGTGLPKSAIEEVQVITGGVPANYGDVTGGLINITTRGPSRNFFGGVEYLTSGYKVGNDITDIVGLDKYAFNQVEGSFSGPILFKKDSLGNKDKPLIGFFISGQYTNTVDPNPSYLGDVRVKPGIRDQFLQDPGRLVSTGANDFTLTYASDYLRDGDIESIKTRQNAGQKTYLASGKIDITTTPTINLTIGGTMDFGNRQNYNRKNALLNADNNYRTKENTFRGFVKFTQRFLNRTEAEEKKATIQNAFYTLQLDYSRYQNNIQDFQHGDNLFDYGYVGKFDRHRGDQYELRFDEFRWVQIGQRDTLVTFTPGTQNPDLASINNFYFNALPSEVYPIAELFGAPEGSDPNYVGYYRNLEAIQGRGGLLNGARPRELYDIWNNIGFIDDPNGAEYRKRQSDQIRFTALGSADIGDHAVSVGVEYEQLTQRRYDLAPIGLWTRARALANDHISEWQDTASFGNFTIPGSIFPFYQYTPNNDLAGQANFDRNLRSSLGLDPNGIDFINTDALDPSAFALDMFSADELVNSGNSNLVNYAGFDHLGNKLTSRPSFDSFFTAKDSKGNFTRLQAPFEPIYIAGYVMDKFAFDDIIFNVGVRVDRYDANQNVLTDPYLWQEAYSAGDKVPNNSIQTQLNNRPSNIGDDFVVYVDNYDTPSNIKGYRNGNIWYSATGVELEDNGSSVQEAGEIRPYLIDRGTAGDLTGSVLSKKAFQDYKPVVNVMPRIAFSFPISDEAVFFAHYDVLVQRPNAIYSRADLMEYAYITNSGNILNNPNLKPTKTIDYELGFQQVLSKSSSLKLSAFYRELRDQIQLVNRTNAWPRSYRSYDNIDFGTVKGFTASFDLRRTGNMWMRASYTLQFADGTGSGPNTGLSLVNSGQANLRTIVPLDFDQRHRFTATADYRYGSGKDYNGPMLFGKPILQRTGLNVVAVVGSGTPYSRSSQVVNEAADATNYRLDGTLNGARLPWQFTTDLQLDRDFPLTFGGKDGDKAKNSNLNLYLLVTNVFNTQNITNVFRFTGSPNNDGFIALLNDQSQIDPVSYRQLYAYKVNDPNNYGAPRTIRLGVRFDF